MDKDVKGWTYGIYIFSFGALINASVVLIMIVSGTGQIAMNLILLVAFSGLAALCIHQRKKFSRRIGLQQPRHQDRCDFCNREGIICRDFTYYSCKTVFEGSSVSSNVIKKFYRHEDFKDHRYQICRRCVRKETFIPLLIFLFIFAVTVAVSLLAGMTLSDVLAMGGFILFLGLISTAVISSSSLRNKPQKKALKERKKEEKKVPGKKDFKITVMTPEEYRKLDDGDKNQDR